MGLTFSHVCKVEQNSVTCNCERNVKNLHCSPPKQERMHTLVLLSTQQHLHLRPMVKERGVGLNRNNGEIHLYNNGDKYDRFCDHRIAESGIMYKQSVRLGNESQFRRRGGRESVAGVTVAGRRCPRRHTSFPTCRATLFPSPKPHITRCIISIYPIDMT